MNDSSPATSTSPTVEFVYVGDVMCSWCWGFAPTLHLLEEGFGAPVRVVNGGLRPGPYARVLDDEMAGYLIHHWEQVGEASGQPFDPSFLDRRDGWKFDSEFPAIAVTAMRERDPASALPFFTDVQHAFFAQGVDITDPEAYRPLLDGYPVESGPFLDHLLGPEAQRAAWKDFEEARSFGVSSFPALLIRTNGTVATVTRGWQPYEQIEGPLRSYLAKQGYESVDGQACTVDENC